MDWGEIRDPRENLGNWVKKAHRRNLGKGNGAAAREGLPVRSSGEGKQRWGRKAGAEARAAACGQQADSRRTEPCSGKLFPLWSEVRKAE